MNETLSTRTNPPFTPNTPGVSASTTQKRVSQYLPISDQIKKATQKTNRRSMIAGCLLGAFVPCAVFLLSHSGPIEDAGGVFKAAVEFPYLVVLILGGLIFSANSVARWGYQAFGQSWIKAIGFVILVEGTLIFAPMQWLSMIALVYLVSINALATGTTLALDRKRQFQLRKDRNNPSGFRKVEITKAPVKRTPPKAKQIAMLAEAIVVSGPEADTAKIPLARRPRKSRAKKTPASKGAPTVKDAEEIPAAQTA